MTVPFYAGILALLFIALSARTIRLRRTLQIAVGDGGKPEMLRAMRVHANFAEYVPFTLLMIFFVESMGASVLLVHGLGVTLIAGRLIHAYGLSQTDEKFARRVLGMVLTFTALAVSAITAILLYFMQGCTLCSAF